MVCNRSVAAELAIKVMKNCRNSIILNLRFMDAAVHHLPFKELSSSCEEHRCNSNQFTMGTDGHFMLYDPLYVCKRYETVCNAFSRDYLHTVLHCVFRHFVTSSSHNRILWDLSCDIAIDYIISEFDFLPGEKDTAEKTKLYKSISERLNCSITADRVYKLLSEMSLDSDYISHLQKIYTLDDHRLWYSYNSNNSDDDNDKNYDDDTENQAPQKSQNNASSQSLDSIAEDNHQQQTTGDNLRISDDRMIHQSNQNPSSVSAKQWEQISEGILIGLETYLFDHGHDSARMVTALKQVNREKYDYTSFLKAFASKVETLHVSDSEFDYVYYSYGLSLYKDRKLPLIEPLEYSERELIRDFVIAIDTSASISDQLVHKFLIKTYNILKSTESFARKIEIHVIQCDAEITDHVVLHNQCEVEQYISSMRIIGRGGTDFRPVFSEVDRLRNQGELTNLKGLLYFTDGFGDYPTAKPSYQSAFVFVEDIYQFVNVPPWAMKVILTPEEIDSIK